MDNDDFTNDPARHALLLAELLDGAEEQGLGPSDIALCTKALRAYADLIDANLA